MDFFIEHSIDGKSWSQIGFKKGNGDSFNLNKYDFNHQSPVNGMNYYRLNQIDFDGTSNYSKVVSLDYISSENLNYSFRIYPNPVDDVLNFYGKINSDCSVRIFDLNGKIIFEKNESQSNFSIDMSYLTSGIYVVNISNTKDVQSMRFVKN